MLKLPDAFGPLYFPVVQTCGEPSVHRDQIPAAGQAWGSLDHPAPVPRLAPPDPAAGHAHPH